MHPRTAEVIEHLDQARTSLRVAVAGIPAGKLGVEPAPGRWSALAVLEHLVLVEGAVSTLLQKKIAEAKEDGLEKETSVSPVLATSTLIPKVLDRTTTIAASERVQPRMIRDPDSIWRSLASTRESLRAVVVGANGLALGKVEIPHPVFGPLHVYDWFAFIVAHEARHAAQIREIGASFAVPA